MDVCVQNADDAGASTLRLCYDRRIHTHTADALVYPGLAGFQGESLLCYNDSVFTPKDFER